MPLGIRRVQDEPVRRRPKKTGSAPKRPDLSSIGGFGGLGEKLVGAAKANFSGPKFGPGPGIMKSPVPPAVTINTSGNWTDSEGVVRDKFGRRVSLNGGPVLQDIVTPKADEFRNSDGSLIDGVYVGPDGNTIDTRDVNGVPAGGISSEELSVISSLLSGEFDPSIITGQKEKELGVIGQLEALAGQQLASQRQLEEQKIAQELARTEQLLAQSFAPRFTAIEEAGERTGEAAAFSAAGRGSVRGSRQAERQVQIAEKTGQAIAALEAEKAMQLQLTEAKLRGASEESLKGLSESLNRLKENRALLEEEVVLAKEGLLAEQQAGAQAAQERQLEQLMASLESTGRTFDPLSGEIVSTLEGQKKMADIAFQDAKTADIYKKLADPNVEIKYFTDELGNVTASVLNLDTGATETVDFGKLGAAQKWAIGALGSVPGGGSVTVSGGTAGGGVSGGVPQATTPQQEIPKGDPAAAADYLVNNGFTVTRVIQEPGAIKEAFGLNDIQAKNVIAQMVKKENKMGIGDFVLSGLTELASPVIGL